jgi:hypothetical protein
MRLQGPQIVDQAGDEQNRAAPDEASEASIARPEPHNERGTCRKNCHTTQTWSWLSMPAILSGNVNDVPRASPSGNKRGQ